MNSGMVYGPTIAVVVVLIIIVVLVLILVLRSNNNRPLQVPSRVNKGANTCLYIQDDRVSMQLNECELPFNSLQRQFQINSASQLTVVSAGNGIACVRASNQVANSPVTWTNSCMPNDETVKWQVVNNRLAPTNNTNNLCIDADSTGNAILANCDNVLPFQFDPVT